MSTIQVDEETKRKLLDIAGRLQSELKKNVTFNDAIRFLIDEYEGKKDFSALRPFFGVLKKSPEEVRRILTELRDEEEKRLEKFTGQSSG
ncbi:MAG: VapB-type antitoxin [Candidatus Freyarchaeum deiterrae]